MALPALERSLTEQLDAVPSRWKRTALRAMYTTAAVVRDRATARLGALQPVRPAETLDVDVLTFSCRRDLLLVVMMLRSFLAGVGLPRRITVVSDGTIGAEERRLIEGVHPVVEVIEIADVLATVDDRELLQRFADSHVLGMKLAALAAQPVERTLVFVDSDIRFLGGAHRLRALLESDGADLAYTVEPAVHGSGPWPGYDERVVGDLAVPPRINSGFVIMRRRPDWSAALARLEPVADAPRYLTEQTTFAVLAATNHGVALPDDEYILDWSDQDRPWDRWYRRPVVLRHYASPVLRWKLWLRGARLPRQR